MCPAPALGAVILTFLFAAMSLPLPADATTPASSKDDIGQYIADHQSDLEPFFEANGEDIVRQAVPVVMGMVAWVVIITMLVGWVIDVPLSRGFAYFFAPAFAEWKRSAIYATGQLVLNFIYTCLLWLAIIFGLKFTFAAVAVPIAVVILLVVGLGAQLVWILYLYRTNFPVAAIFYLGVIIVHSIVFLLVAKPVIGLRATSVATDFVDQAITPRLQAEANAMKQQLADANSGRTSSKVQAAQLNDQIAQAQADADELGKEIEAKKNSDIYAFSQIVQIRARGDLEAARDQLGAFASKFPSSSLVNLAQSQLAQVNDQLAAADAEKKKEADDAARAAAQAQADLLARAAKGEATLSEMRQALIGKSRAEVSKLLGLPTDTASDTWGYRQQMIFNPITNERHGLLVYFSEGTVQGVDYNMNVGSGGAQ